MQNKVIQAIYKYKIIAIFRNVEVEDVIPAAQALYQGGIRLIEVTFNQSEDPDRTLESIQRLTRHFGDNLQVGAGTVITALQVETAVKAGAKYLISPHTDCEIVHLTKKIGAVSIPGAATPTEIVQAHKAGADLVKIFPAGELGLKYFQSLIAPINFIPMIAVGGINEKNTAAFLDAGAKGVGIGSNLVNTNLIKEGKFDELVHLAQRFVILACGITIAKPDQ